MSCKYYHPQGYLPFNKDIVFDCGITLGWLVGLGKKERDFPITHEVTQFNQWPFLLLCKYFFLVYLYRAVVS